MEEKKDNKGLKLKVVISFAGLLVLMSIAPWIYETFKKMKYSYESLYVLAIVSLVIFLAVLAYYSVLAFKIE